MTYDYTHNEIVETSLERLVKQGKPALTNKGGCVYRTTDGLGCAVGILLTDEDAKVLDAMDEGGLSYILDYIRGDLDPDYVNEDNVETLKALSPECSAMLTKHQDVLMKMQHAHDDVRTICRNDITVEDFIPHIQKTFKELLK